eukprot:556256-Pleurochrysis_carterae.AAC.1
MHAERRAVARVRTPEGAHNIYLAIGHARALSLARARNIHSMQHMARLFRSPLARFAALQVLDDIVDAAREAIKQLPDAELAEQ